MLLYRFVPTAIDLMFWRQRIYCFLVLWVFSITLPIFASSFLNGKAPNVKRKTEFRLPPLETPHIAFALIVNSVIVFLDFQAAGKAILHVLVSASPE